MSLQLELVHKGQIDETMFDMRVNERAERSALKNILLEINGLFYDVCCGMSLEYVGRFWLLRRFWFLQNVFPLLHNAFE